jgi:hypothetical protein
MKVIVVAVGLVAGALGALGQGYLDGTLEAFFNSLSTWLVAPFVVGMLAATRREAAIAGLATCAFQLAGYYVVAPIWGFESSASLVAFWFASALVGGPVFGAAGHLVRTGVPGLGIAVLAGAFVAEGLYAYMHQQHAYLTGTLWVAIGAALALHCARGRPEQLRWLGLTVPLGHAGEAAVTTVLTRFF